MNKQIAIFVLLGFFGLSACTGRNSSPTGSTQQEAEQQIQIELTTERFQQYGLDPETARQEATKYISAKSLAEKNQIFKTATGQDDNEAQKFNQATNNIEISDNRRNTIRQSLDIKKILEGNNKRAKQALIQDNCVLNKNQFAQGADDNLYGKACLDGKYLEIKTSKKGTLQPAFSSFSANSKNGDQNIQENVDFLSTSYEVKYSVLTNQGDDRDYALLLKFLQSNERFIGSKDTRYRILFRIFKDYLVLYKASKNKDDFPQNERMTGYANSGLQKEGDYYMIPFIGYPISFCVAEPIRNSNNQITNQNRINCDNISQNNSKEAPYIKIDIKQKQVFTPVNKSDWFPIDYFDGEWYYTKSLIESSTADEVTLLTLASLVTFERSKNNLNVTDTSIESVNKDAKDSQKKIITLIPIEWNHFELDLQGEKFQRFAEREYQSDSNDTSKPYVKVDFESFVWGDSSLSNLVVMEDFFAFTENRSTPQQKVRYTFLKRKSLDSKGFQPRRWFQDDSDNFYGTLNVEPEQGNKSEGHSTDERKKYARMQKFNTALNTSEEQSHKTKVIKWYYSKSSTTDPEYRAMAQKAIDIYNKAFEKIMGDACPQEIKNKNQGKDCPKIQVQLVSDEPKDLGDVRYNIINLIWEKETAIGFGNRLLLGVAPSSVDPTTGQIIGAVANIVINNNELILKSHVRNYIRYEVFQKDKKTEKENETHAVTPYLRAQIAKNCSEVADFITTLQDTNIRQNKKLEDEEVMNSCSEKLSKQSILGIILHELGHNFGLAHNFMCSMDLDNFYADHQEIKSIFGNDSIDDLEPLSKSSCVMDYMPFDQPPMNVLGKYDLAALKFLYADQAEVLTQESRNTFKDTVVDLQLNKEPLNQTPLSESDKNLARKYLKCTDADEEKNILMCKASDYGSTPEEAVREKYSSIKRLFNHIRYRYDADEKDFIVREDGQMATPFNNPISPIENRIFGQLFEIVSYYYRWLSLKTQLIESKEHPSYTLYQPNNKEAVIKYTDVLEEYYQNGADKEYKKFYPVKRAFKEILLDILFLEEMSCKITPLQQDQSSKSYWFTLEFLKDQASDKSNLYVENCFSESIQQLTEKETEISQKGLENFSGYYSNTSHPNFKRDVIPIDKLSLTQLVASDDPSLSGAVALFFGMVFEEPDVTEEMYSRLKLDLLKRETFASKFKGQQIVELFSLAQAITLGFTSRNLEIHTKNINDMRIHTISLQNSTPNSFYQNIQRTLNDGVSIEIFNQPFLTSAYTDYQKNYKDEMSFQDYMINKEDTVVWDNDTLVYPHQSESFVREIIKNLKKSQDRLTEVSKLEDLDIWTKYEKQTLENERELLAELLGLI